VLGRLPCGFLPVGVLAVEGALDESNAQPGPAQCAIIVCRLELGNRRGSNLEEVTGAVGAYRRAQKGQLDLGTKPDALLCGFGCTDKDVFCAPDVTANPKCYTELAGELVGCGIEVDCA
jgi:hypothetical protein